MQDAAAFKAVLKDAIQGSPVSAFVWLCVCACPPAILARRRGCDDRGGGVGWVSTTRRGVQCLMRAAATAAFNCCCRPYN
jgi:hypothetical protein